MPSLLDILSTGLRGTADAFQSDVEDVKNLQLPRQAMRAAGDVFAAYQNPMMGTHIPNIPKYYSYGQAIDDARKTGGEKAAESLLKDYANLGISTDLKDVVRSGYTTLTDYLLNQSGKVGNLIQEARKIGSRAGEIPDAMASTAGKVFKPQPSTMEELIKSLSNAKEGVGGRGRLLPVLKDMATGEEYIGPRGGNHPWEQYQAAMAARKGLAQAKTIAPGFKVAETAPFMPPELAQHLAFPEGVSQVNRLLDKGLSMQSIVEALRMGKQVEK